MSRPPLDPETWRRVDALFNEALELAPEDRAAFLDRIRASSPAIAEHLAELLAADARAATFLESPIGAPDSPFPDEAIRPGVLVGPWRLLREIGRGGMGVVYFAERSDGQFDQRAAVKIVRSGAGGSVLRGRFLQERRILARLEHPRIARLLDGGVLPDGRPWFAMEHVDGASITTYADRERLSVEARVDLFVRVCDAVAAAQTHLVVHRDLKPSNILVGADGEPKLLDFGIAKIFAPEEDPLAASGTPVDSPPPLTREGARLFTPEYAAPEQLRGDPVTTATDTWALGCILFELLSGRRPFESRTGEPYAIERAVLTGETDPLPRAVTQDAASARRTTARALRRRLTGDLANIASRALAKEPGARYATAADLRSDLVRWREGRPVLARAPSFGYTARKSIARHKVAFAGAAAVLFALVAGLATTAWQARRAEREAERAARVTEFLSSLFDESDPNRTQGVERTASELLERGATRLETELAQDPDLRAELLATVGRLQLKLGDAESARALHERAIEIVSARFGARHPRVGDGLGDLGAALHALGRFEEADSVLSRALEIARDARPRDDARRATATGNLAAARFQLGRHEEAAQLHRDALALDRGVHGDRSEPVAVDLSNLSNALLELGRLDEAEAAARESVAIRRALHPGDNTETATALANLGSVLVRRGDRAAAESTLREAIAMRRRLFPDGHPHLATSLRNWGDLARSREDFAAAESAYVEALAMNRRHVGEGHVEVANGVNDLAVLAYFRRDLPAARDGFADALARFEAALPEGHPTILTVRANLATVRMELGDLAGAERDQRALLAARIRALGDRHPTVANDWRAVGGMLGRSGRWKESADCYRSALAILLENRGEEDPDVAETRSFLARPLAWLGEIDEARRLADGAAAALEAALPAGHRRIRNARIERGYIRLLGGDASLALPDLEEGYRGRLEEFGETDRSTADAGAWLGECLVAVGRVEEGRARLAAALPTLRATRGDRDPITRRAGEILARSGK